MTFSPLFLEIHQSSSSSTLPFEFRRFEQKSLDKVNKHR